MSRNIVSTIEKEDSSSMLVLVGKNHVAGITDILTTQFGFEKVPLPSAPTQ